MIEEGRRNMVLTGIQREARRTAGKIAQIFSSSKRYVRTLAARHAAYRISGLLYGSKRQVSVLAVGPPGFEGEIPGVFFSEAESTVKVSDDLRSPAEHDLARLQEGADIVAVVPRAWQKPSAADLYLRLSLDSPIFADGNPEAYARERMSKDHRRALQRRSQYPLTFTISTRPDDFRRWYDDLMAPLAILRHGGSASIPDYRQVELMMPRAEIALAHLDGRLVAGELLLYDRLRTTLTAWRVGMHESVTRDAKLYKTINVALDYFGLERAALQGVPRFSLGYTVARVDVGPFMYKRRWGCAFEEDRSAPGCFVRFVSGRALEILRDVPLIVPQEGGLWIHIGAPSVEAQEVERLAQLLETSTFPTLRGIVARTPSRHASALREQLARRRLEHVKVEPFDG